MGKPSPPGMGLVWQMAGASQELDHVECECGMCDICVDYVFELSMHICKRGFMKKEFVERVGAALVTGPIAMQAKKSCMPFAL